MLNGDIPSRFRVAVLGANGQVGTELCLYLKAMEFCDPVGISRSSHSTALLMRAGIECRWGDLNNPSVAAGLLADCDLIFDLALPSGKNLRETKRIIRERASSILSAARPSKGFILASTTAVYRYTASQPFFRAYRSMKLFAERLVQSLGLKYGVRVYIFRLGQVYGALQSCSETLKQGLLKNSSSVNVPDQWSDAVFVFSIAEAIRSVLFNSVPQETYTMISSPAWSCADLVELYAQQLGLSPTVILERVRLKSPVAHAVSELRSWLRQGLLALVEHHKELLSAIVSAGSERLDEEIRFARNRRMAASTINGYFRSLTYSPFEPINEPRGNRFPVGPESRTAMANAEQRVEKLIQQLLEPGLKNLCDPDVGSTRVSGHIIDEVAGLRVV
jgi:nucleoside-diphosphate-sugar epimerase